jgi:hypothetical protein
LRCQPGDISDLAAVPGAAGGRARPRGAAQTSPDRPQGSHGGGVRKRRSVPVEEIEIEIEYPDDDPDPPTVLDRHRWLAEVADQRGPAGGGGVDAHRELALHSESW